MRKLTVFLFVVLLSASCNLLSRSRGEDSAAALAAVARAHDAYVAAINANKAEVWLAALGDDVVYMVPNRPAIVGKADVGSWVGRYLNESTTHWTKATQDLVVSGDWAFGRYIYTVSDDVVVRDPETDGGGTANESGWGFVVYHRDADGVWRVARDGWGSYHQGR